MSEIIQLDTISKGNQLLIFLPGKEDDMVILNRLYSISSDLSSSYLLDPVLG